MEELAEAAHVHGHPGPRVYVQIAVVLAIITLAEVGAFYLPNIDEGLHPYVTPAFLILSAAKFVLVVGFYMHLKFDPRFFAGVFAFFLLIAASVAVAFIALFHGFYFF